MPYTAAEAMLNHITTNLANAPIRHEKLHGRSYVVAPMAMITAGVHNGSNGALLYEEADIKKAVPAWNMKPIVVYHPQINNKGISAADRDVLEKQQVGMVMNTSYQGGKLRAEAWIEVERANAVDDRVMDALENNRMMEVSTGLFTDNDAATGTWNGAGRDEPYVAIARNHQPDHLALLPDQVGACSIADGAGLLMLNAEAAQEFGAEVMDAARRIVGNKMSHSNTHTALAKALDAKVPKMKKGVGEDSYMAGPWLVDVYDKFFVYEMDGTLYRLNYTTGKAGVEITGDAEQVMRVTEYRTTDNKFVGNSLKHSTTANQNKKPEMKKEEIIDGLISNAATQWGEEDRETLTALDEATLNKMAPPFKKKGAADDEEDADGKAKKPTKNAATAGDEEVPAAEPAKNTAEAYIASAPPEIQEVLRNGLTAHAKEQETLITEITANANNAFSKDYLATKGLDELRGIAALAKQPTANTAQPQAQPGAVPMFTGAATLTGNQVQPAVGEAPLAAPVMNFTTEEKG